MARRISSRARKDVPSPGKAQEMLDNPPKNQPGTKRQKRFFRALAHGWKPSGKMKKGK